jgi:hypothetical protein
VDEGVGRSNRDAQQQNPSTDSHHYKTFQALGFGKSGLSGRAADFSDSMCAAAVLLKVTKVDAPQVLLVLGREPGRVETRDRSQK